MSQRPANYPKYNERGRRQWRRYCVVCGAELYFEYRAHKPLCKNCKGNTPSDPVLQRLGKKPWYIVVSCPDWEYSRGATFSGREILEMQKMWNLIPGMQLEYDGVIYRAVSENKLEEVIN